MNNFNMKSIFAQMVITVSILIITWMLYIPSALAGATLENVRKTGLVRCGVGEQLAGFSLKSRAGRWEGFTVDFCRAVAVAALGDSEKVSFTPLSPSSRFPVLLSGKIDLLAHTATVTFGREASIGVEFAGIYFFDGQAFIVPRKSGLRKIEDLNGKSICVEKGTTHQKNLENTFRVKGLTYKPLVLDTQGEMVKAFLSGKCQAYTGDRSSLTAILVSVPGGSSQFEILPGNISKEPLGPVVRRGDEEWFTLVKWVLFALIEAEERGVTRENVRTLQKKSTDPALLWFLNSSGQAGGSLKVKPDWVATMIAQVGNYGEIYERYFGSRSVLKIERGMNRLWNRGGLLFAPPFQ